MVEKLAKEKEEVREKLEETCSGNLQLDQMLPGDSGEQIIAFGNMIIVGDLDRAVVGSKSQTGVSSRLNGR